MMKPRHKNRISLEGNGMDNKAADIRKDGFVIRGAANWDLLCWEMKKLWSQPMILVFLLLCIAFQIFLAAEDRYFEPGGDYAIYVARMTKETGRRMGREFTEAMDGAGKNMRNMDAKDETLPWEKQDGEGQDRQKRNGQEQVREKQDGQKQDRQEQNEQRKEGQAQDRQDQDGQIAAQAKGEQESLYRERFLRETADREDIFADYSCMKLADGLLRQFYITGWPARMMERKYEKQQEAVDLLAERKDSLDVSSAGMTQPVADALFQTQCRMLITEAMVLAMLMALSVSGSERTARTHLTVCVTRTGRKIRYVKAAAGLMSALAAYGMLAVSAVGFFALIWYPAPDWGASISSQFHHMSLAGTELPFITWKPFTVGEYLLAVVGMGSVVVMLFYVLAFCLGLWIKSAWGGFVLLILLVAVNFQVIMMAGDSLQWGLYLCAQWTPAGLWWSQNQWFTDMLISGAVPWQECATAALWAALCLILLAVSFHHMKKEDIN